MFMILLFACLAKDREECGMPKDPGSCLAYDPVFFYNNLTKNCERFIYGGCGGNGNRFETVDECFMNCLNFRKEFFN